MGSVKAVLFDLDNTLCDYWASSRQALTDALDLALTCYPACDRDALRRDYFLVNREAQEAAGTPGFVQGYTRSERFGAMLLKHGIEDPELAVRLATLFEQQIVARLTLFDETRAVLDALHGKLFLGVLSNGNGAVQREKLAVLQIAHYFDGIYISEEIGIAKPDPAIFHRALEHSGVAAADTLFVGDSQDQDIPGAKAAGVIAVWLNRRGRDHDPAYPEPDHIIGSLIEVLPLAGHPIPSLSGAERIQ